MSVTGRTIATTGAAIAAAIITRGQVGGDVVRIIGAGALREGLINPLKEGSHIATG